MAIHTVPKQILDNMYKELADNGTFVRGSGFATNAPTTIFTVGVNKVVYIISATLGWRATAVNAGGDVDMKFNDAVVIQMQGTNIDEDHDVTTQNYSIPIRFTAGQTVKIESGAANLTAFGSVVGYEVAA